MSGPPPPRPGRHGFQARIGTLLEGVRIAWDAILANRIRAGLTILGVGVGVSVVVIIAALVTGVRSSLSEAFEDSGPDNFIVFRFDPSAIQLRIGGIGAPWEGKPVIEPEEAERIAGLSTVEEAVYITTLGVNAEFDGQEVEGIEARGMSPGWPSYTTGDFIAGRDFTDAEVRQSRAVIVISSNLAEILFGPRDPIGKRIRVASPNRGVRESFRVVGVFQPEENVFSGLVENFAILPYTTALKRLKASKAEANILVVPRPGISPLRTQDDVIAALRSERGLGPRDENNFTLIESAQLLNLFDQFSQAFLVVLLGLSSAGLLVGGVGVIGIMLISVTERTREIGVRKALGATRREILWQFLVEASVLTLLGAGVGLLLGGAVAYGVAEFTPVPARIPLWSVAAALLAAALTGIIFGILPAQRAARLEPVDALRAE